MFCEANTQHVMVVRNMLDGISFVIGFKEIKKFEMMANVK